MDPTVPNVATLNEAAVTVAVGGLVLSLTQATKRWTPEGWGPIIAALWTTVAVVVYFISQADWPPPRFLWFGMLAVWVAVYVSALGLYSASMVPSSSRQSIGTGDGHQSVGDSNVPVGETKPKPKRTRKPKAAPAPVVVAPVGKEATLRG